MTDEAKNSRIFVKVDGIDKLIPFDKGTDVKDIQSTVRKIQSGEITLPDDRSTGQKIAGGAAAFGSGAASGAFGATIGLPRGLMDIGSWLESKAMGLPPTPVANTYGLPSTGDFEQYMKDKGLYHTAQTPVEKFLQAGGEGMGSMINPFSPLKYTKGMAALGALSGVTGEAASRVVSDEPWARMAGNIIGLLPGAVKFRTPRDVRAVQDTLNEFSIPELEAAAARQKNATETLGVPTSITHQLPPTAPLVQVANAVAASPGGIGLRKAAGAEQAALGAKQQDLIGSFGNNELGSMGENAVQKAGIGATYTTPQDVRKSITDPLYATANATESVPGVKEIVDAITAAQGRANAVGGGAGRAVDQAVNDLNALEVHALNGRWGPEGNIPIQELDNLRQVYQDSGRTTGLSSSEDIQRAHGFRTAGTALADYLDATAPNLTQAKGTFENISQQLTNPVAEGALGKIFPDPKVTKGNFANQTGILSSRWAPADVADFAQRLTKEDPAAFPTIMQKAALDATQNGTASFPSFVENLVGKGPTEARANVLEGVKQSALANGLPMDAAEAAAAGADNLFNVMSDVGAGSDRMLKGGIDVGAVAEKTGGEYNPLRWPQVASQAISSAVRKNAYSKISKLFYDPDGLQKLIDISQYSPSLNAAQIMTRALTSADAQAEAEQGPSPGSAAVPGGTYKAE